MASLMVARPGPFGIVGLAPRAKVLPIALPLAGTTDAGGDDHLARAIRDAVDHRAKIISMALTGAAHRSGGAEACPAPEQTAIFYALDRGAVVFAAGGNRGRSDNAVEDPAVCLGVVSVGAVDSAGTVAPLSSRHSYLTLTAPGVNIPTLSRRSGAAYAGDGTSQATALAAASAALVWSAHPQLTGRQVVARMLATLDHRRASPDPARGYGTLDTYRAVTARVAADARNPVYRAAARFRAGDPALEPGRAGVVLPDALAAAGIVLVLAAVRRFRGTHQAVINTTLRAKSGA
jgi:subtilisin family serine protease